MIAFCNNRGQLNIKVNIPSASPINLLGRENEEIKSKRTVNGSFRFGGSYEMTPRWSTIILAKLILKKLGHRDPLLCRICPKLSQQYLRWSFSFFKFSGRLKHLCFSVTVCIQYDFALVSGAFSVWFDSHARYRMFPWYLQHPAGTTHGYYNSVILSPVLCFPSAAASWKPRTRNPSAAPRMSLG